MRCATASSALYTAATTTTAPTTTTTTTTTATTATATTAVTAIAAATPTPPALSRPLRPLVATRCGCSTSASVTVMDAESGLELAAARLVDEKTVPGRFPFPSQNLGGIDYKEVDPLSRPGYPPLGDHQGGPQGKTKEVAMIVTAGGRDHSLLVATSPKSPLKSPLTLLDLLSFSP